MNVGSDMDRRSALVTIAASGAAIMLPGVAEAAPFKSEYVAIYLHVKSSDGCPEPLLKKIPDSIREMVKVVLSLPRVVGLDKDAFIKVKLFGNGLWLEEDSDLQISAGSLVNKRFWRSGRKLMSRSVGGSMPKYEHLAPGRFEVFRRALDLHLGNHVMKKLGPVDRDQLDRDGFTDKGGYLARRLEERRLIRAEALSSLSGYHALIPVWTRETPGPLSSGVGGVLRG